MAMRAVKHQYFSAFIVSAENHVVALFRITRTLLRVLEVYLQDCAEEFSLYLIDEIAQIFLSWIQSVDVCGNAWGMDLPCYLGTVSSFQLGEVGRVFGSVISTICELDPCPSWLVKAPWEVTYGWVLVMVNSSFREEVVPSTI